MNEGTWLVEPQWPFERLMAAKTCECCEMRSARLHVQGHPVCGVCAGYATVGDENFTRRRHPHAANLIDAALCARHARLVEKHDVAETNPGGVKYDDGKLRYDLLPPEALAALAGILTSGAEKYGECNWEAGMDWHRPFAAAMRHLWAWWGGEDLDPESGKSHLHHALTNLAFLTTYEIRGIGNDTRA